VGGIAEIIDNNGFLLESEDEKALFDAMKLFIYKKVSFSKSEIAQNAQKRYSVEAISSKFIELYQKIA
jgi:glycosyltransferase involved in cell wall biosynthesis